jgi:PAS domain S-box-containing protein
MDEQDGRAGEGLPPEAYAALVEDAPFGIFVVQDGRIVYGNRWLREFGGYRVNERETLGALEVIHPDDRPQVIEQMQLRLSGGAALPHYPVRFLKRDGTQCPVELHAKVVDYRGRPAVEGALLDISTARETARLRQSQEVLERLVAERTAELEALNQELRTEIERGRQGEERVRLFTAALDAAGEGIYLVGLDGRIVYVNKAVEGISGTSPEEYIGKPVASLSADSDLPGGVIMPALRRCGAWAGEVAGRRKDGSPVTIWLNASLVRDPQGRPVAMVGIGKNMSVQKRLEEDSIKNQKLESIGVLAGGLAHDFNNLLTIIMGNLDLARLFCGAIPDAAEALDHAAEAAMRAGDLTRQLITFSKGGRPVKEVGDVGRVLRDTVVFASSGSNVACEFDLAPDLPLVEFDEGQIRQVIHNLVQNAREAMPEGGTLQVRARKVQLAEGEIPSLPTGVYARIDVVDHGIGIARDHLSRIFDPYFSTKEMTTAKGRGLGLAVSHSIVRSHGGAIAVDSRPGRGTTLSLFLPAASPEAVEAAMEEEDGSEEEGWDAESTQEEAAARP